MDYEPPLRTVESPFRQFVALCVVLVSLPVILENNLVPLCANSKQPRTALAACAYIQDNWHELDAASISLVHRHRSRAYIELKRTEDALHEAGLAATTDPDSEVSLQLLAWIYLHEEDYPAAMRAIERALMRAPNNTYSLKMKAYLSRTLSEV